MDHLVMAGGVSLNCVANGKLLDAGIFDDIWIQPAAGDAGGAVGAAYAGWHIWQGQERPLSDSPSDAMRGAYLGPAFSDNQVMRACRKYGAVHQCIDDDGALFAKVAVLLDQGKVIGWFQGRMEYGPRALGNRSILGDPRNPEMQKRLNLKIKYREGFRPFAPSVLAEEAAEYFDLTVPSPYMLLIEPVRQSHRSRLPDRQKGMGMYERLYQLRSDIPAVTHVDCTARIQTVHRETNERYWNLIRAFKELTGCGLLVNTSFNVRGEPIVCTPEDAYRCFMRTEMDYLVMNNFLFSKAGQPVWRETESWQDRYELD
jgi:carbamoyltransferase